MQFNGQKLTRRITTLTFVVGSFKIPIQACVMCCWTTGHCNSFTFSQYFPGAIAFLTLGLCSEAVSPPLCPTITFYCFISVTGTCFSPLQLGAHGCVARICQPRGQPSSRSWLPIVEAPGSLRHPLCEAVVS